MIGLFRNKEIKKLMADLDSYFDCLDRASMVFSEGVRNYLYNNRNEFSTNLSEMTKLKNELNEHKRTIEHRLYSQNFLLRTQGDIMRLLEKSRDITNMLYDSLFQFEIEMPLIPSDLNAGFMKLTELSMLSVQTAVSASKNYFRDPEMISDKIDRMYYYENESTRHAQDIKRMVFHKMESLKLSEKFHLRYFALHIENVAKASENLADQLAVMVAKGNF